MMAGLEMSGTKKHCSLINTRPWKAKNYSPEASPEVRPAKTPSFLASLYIGEKVISTYSFPSYSPMLCDPMHQEEVRVGPHRSLFRFSTKKIVDTRILSVHNHVYDAKSHSHERSHSFI